MPTGLQAESRTDATVAPRTATLAQLMRWLALVLLFSTAALSSGVRFSALPNGDIWWHLRTGMWILQAHAVPHQPLFSQHTGSSWIVNSWAYDAILALAYRAFGLRIFPLLLMAFKIALAVVTLLLALGRAGNLWLAVALSAVAQFAITGLQPTPAAVSILFFGIELWLLLCARYTARPKTLFWLPPLFCAWANTDLQFILGLGLLLLFAASVAIEAWVQGSRREWAVEKVLPLKQTTIVVAVSFLATLVTPYFIRLLPDAIHGSYSRTLFDHFANMSALGFRRPPDFLILLLAMGTFVVLARRHPPDVFHLSVMISALVLGLRVQRDSWIVVFGALGVIGDSLPAYPKRSVPSRSRISEVALALAAACLILLTFSIRLPHNDRLMGQVATEFPVQACDFIRSKHFPQPIFNEYSWGGFLTWYLPEYPVAVDSRLSVYDDRTIESYFKIIDGKERMELNPMFSNAQTILLRRESSMAKALTTLPPLQAEFSLEYQDSLAVVLVRK